jgi:hypothetical protein
VLNLYSKKMKDYYHHFNWQYHSRSHVPAQVGQHDPPITHACDGRTSGIGSP